MRAKLRRTVLVGIATTLGIAIWPAVSLASQETDPVAVTTSASSGTGEPLARWMANMKSAPSHDDMMQDRR